MSSSSATRERLGRHFSRVDVGLALITLGGFAFLAWHTGRVTEWFVMTDELLNVKLAVAVADSWSPVPHVHGEYFGALSVLYPIVNAPLYGLLGMPDAFRAVHILNAALMASAAVPAYLLTRSVVPASVMAARLVAALTVLVPWTAMSLMVMTESVAYPVFLWALLAFQLAAVDPSPRRDLIALGALGLAFFARTQFIVLAAVLPLMILVHEAGYSALTPGGSPREVWPAVRRAASAHRVLLVVVAGSALVGLALAVTGSLGKVLGSYEVTATEGSLLPPGIHDSVVTHLDFVIVAIGILPFILGGAWIVAALVRPPDRPSHAFAVMSVGTIPLLAYEVASFNLRFANGGVQERYLFYIAPLLFIGMAAWLADDRRRVALPVVAAGAVFAIFADYAAYTASPGPFFSSPASAFHQVLDGRSLELGDALGFDDLSPVTVVTVFSLVAAVALALVARVWRPPGRLLLLLVGGPVLLFCALETNYVLDRITASGNGSRPADGGSLAGRDWIDQALPDGESAGLLPSQEGTFPAQSLWWETEFFNKRVDRAFEVGDGTTYTPFPAGELSLEFATGSLRGTEVGDYLVTGTRDLRFRLAGEPVATSGDLALLRPERPLRALWAAQDVDPSSGSLVSRRPLLRLYGGERTELTTVTLALGAAADARRGFRVESGGRTIAGSLPVGDTRTLRLQACVPVGDAADISIRPRGQPAPTASTVVVAGVVVEQTGRDCTPA